MNDVDQYLLDMIHAFYSTSTGRGEGLGGNSKGYLCFVCALSLELVSLC